MTPFHPKPRRFPSLLFALGLLVGLPGVAQAAEPKRVADKPGRVSSVADLQRSGWKIDRPSYPFQSLQRHEQGDIQVTMTTDRQGRVIRAAVPPSTRHPILDSHVSNWVRAHWQGPPNATRTTVLTFQLR